MTVISMLTVNGDRNENTQWITTVIRLRTGVVLTFPRTAIPESGGSFVFAQRLPWSQNFQVQPQALILTDSIAATLEPLHPDGHYAIAAEEKVARRAERLGELGVDPDCVT